MTLEQLRMLCAIVDEGSVAAASRRLNKTQPALSNAVSRLEGELGFALFDRSSYRLTLSEPGKSLCAQFREVLNKVESIEATAAFLAAGHEPSIVISLEVLTPTSCISRIIGSISRKFPATQVSLTSDVMGGAVEKLHAGSVDIAIGPRVGAISNVEASPVTSVELIAVGAPGQFAKVDASKLSNHLQVIIPETTRQSSGRSFATPGDSRRLYAADYIAKKQLLIDGVGWGFMPQHLVSREISDNQLIHLDCVRRSRRSIDIYAFRLADGHRGPVNTRIWEELRNGLLRSSQS
ncbi:MAG: LysR family transcriptional regulator [Woeseiaceae bacterium]|nr:LysR family transcriptional regulator [Woeseiaceae bacterium]